MPDKAQVTVSRSKAYGALMLTSVLWGTTWVGSKVGVSTGIHPLYFSSIRQLLGGSCYLLFFLATGKAVMPTAKQWRYLIMMGLILFVFSNGLTTWGVKYINSGLGAIIGAIAPLFVALIEWSIGDKDRPNFVSIIGLLLGFLGVGIIFYEHLTEFSSSNFILGIVFSVLGTFTWSMGTIILSRNKAIELNRYYSLGWQMFIAGAILFVISHIRHLAQPLSSFTPKLWLSFLWMVTMGSILAFGAFLYTIQKLPTTLASIYAYINPMVAVVLGHFLLGEKWSFFLVAGALVTLLGVYLVNRGFQRYMRQQEEPQTDQA